MIRRGEALDRPWASPAIDANLPRPAGTVKICGLQDVAAAVAAVQAGATMLGTVFAPSRRQLTIDAARVVADAARDRATTAITIVGVFVDASPAEVNRIVEAVGLDAVQLHGNESPALLAAISAPVIKAIRPRPAASADTVQRQIASFLGVPNEPFAFLLDGFSDTAAGGVGVSADWTLAASLAASYPLILAGGLTPDNVGGAIVRVKPAAVDVSSGVETQGAKDTLKIASFVARARRAFDATDGPGEWPLL